ncbi:adenylate/guanylate cyclase domain-containing response regulator [Sediminicurvatus halobius]|uniref:Adenylate/guanylate cyclase domain-containing response regulator n=1 Tax=Sediminicurvatus halobius TaxID=2182432 RepID=A0A2U2N717_9GAMM|nr:adenylate/guanylate cyclase domain-containing response regulator [Spiribacter halobius]PWG64920.1 hypothetical protein DEM34_03750 [Spiribacter halobius]UEX78223.1 response regulator [Spiribacter halobius]
MASGEHSPIVLVVDDDPASRRALSRILEAAGYRTKLMGSMAAVRRYLARQEPDAFVLSAEMDGIDGIELCWRLREDERFRMTPILVATSSEDRYLLRSAFTAGADDFLVKPLEPLVVVARLGGLLKKREYYKQLEAARAELARYVSPRIRTLIERRLDSREPMQTAPTLEDVCILFSDIRGFTALSQTIDPPTLFRTVSEHLGVQVDCVYRHGGYVDKFGGDGLMAVFDGERMGEKACRCALDIIDRVGVLKPPGCSGAVPIGIGIHAGPVVLGNIGTGEHLDYTAIGESVNVAARLCGYAEPQSVIVSEALRERVGDPRALDFREPRSVQVRGVSEPVLLYHLARAPLADTRRA